MKTLDSDASGEIDEKEWINNLEKLPGLKLALQKDLDFETGKLNSFRTPRQQFANCCRGVRKLFSLPVSKSRSFCSASLRPGNFSRLLIHSFSSISPEASLSSVFM